MVRRPAVAGQFYPGDRKNLEAELSCLIKASRQKIDAIGIISPHAGYMYSGGVAGSVYGLIKPAETYVILSPNHTGMGEQFSMSADDWQTPLGVAAVDADMEKSILAGTDLIIKDPVAHRGEHSVEVQIPFIQKISGPEAKIVPITMMPGSIPELERFAAALASAVRASKRKTVIVASSDMTHYESRESAGRKDRAAIEKIVRLDAAGLLKKVIEDDISMCGCFPAAAMIMAAKELGAKKAELVEYADSGDVTGDSGEVVGYAGIVVI